MPPERRPCDQEARFKREAAEHALTLVRPGMTVGLGSGSTADFATRRLAELVRGGELPGLVAVATSRAVWRKAVRLGVPMLTDDLPRELDLTVDGADEVDPELDLIKGGGGALLREKIVAQASRRLVVVVDESKLSPRLGQRRSLPVEVLPFGWRSTARFLAGLGARVQVRAGSGGAPYATDQGNLILDCSFGPIADPERLGRLLEGRAGVVGHGLFLGLASEVVVAGPSGLRVLRRGAG